MMQTTPVPPWVSAALLELGTTEAHGPADNPRIVAYHAVTSLKATDDEVPWCASFANWCLLQGGVRGTGSAASRSFLSWGVACGPRLGAITVFSRGSDPKAGHVGFYLCTFGGLIQVINGNMTDRVVVSNLSASKLLGYRWPK